MLTSSAAFVGAVFLLMHLPHRLTLCLMFSIIPGQKKCLRINDVVRSRPWWPKSSWYALKMVSIKVVGSTN